jgi:hypothetical protein
MMFARSVEDALNQLAEASAITSSQACLERSSTALLHDPGDGDSLVRALGSAEQGQGAVDDMLQILTATLDGADGAGRRSGTRRGSYRDI